MDVQELKSRARAAVVSGRLEQAEVLYRQVLTRVPRDAGAWLRHAETLRRLDRVNDAVWSYRTASTILLSLGHEARAIAGLKLALGLKPDDVDLVTEIIRVELHRHRRLAARGQAASPSPVPLHHVSWEDLDKPQLALPMLGPVDLRPSTGSAVAGPPGVAAGAGAVEALADVQRAAEAALGVEPGPPVEFPGAGLPLPTTPVPAAPPGDAAAAVGPAPASPGAAAPVDAAPASAGAAAPVDAAPASPGAASPEGVGPAVAPPAASPDGGAPASTPAQAAGPADAGAAPGSSPSPRPSTPSQLAASPGADAAAPGSSPSPRPSTPSQLAASPGADAAAPGSSPSPRPSTPSQLAASPGAGAATPASGPSPASHPVSPPPSEPAAPAPHRPAVPGPPGSPGWRPTASLHLAGPTPRTLSPADLGVRPAQHGSPPRTPATGSASAGPARGAGPGTPPRGSSPSTVRRTSPWPEIRRLNDREVAIKASPDSPWVVITATSPLEVRLTETLAVDEELTTPWVD